MPNIDQQLGQRVVDTFKVASDLLEAANADLDAMQEKTARYEADTKAANPVAIAAIDKLASIVIDGEPLVFPDDVQKFKAAAETKQGMAKILLDVVGVLADRPATAGKTASELGSPSDARDPYAQTASSQRSGFAGLPHTRSIL